jgi:hypothetical protein
MTGRYPQCKVFGYVNRVFINAIVGLTRRSCRVSEVRHTFLTEELVAIEYGGVFVANSIVLRPNRLPPVG